MWVSLSIPATRRRNFRTEEMGGLAGFNVGSRDVLRSVPASCDGAPLPSPIAPASDGRLQCYAPNPATKSGQSLAEYQSRPDGTIMNPATVLISVAPPITMRTVTPVTIKAGQVCGYIRPEGIEAAEFAIGGNPATEGQTALFKDKIAASQKCLFGHEICTAYVTDGDALVAKASVDGVAQPAMDQKVIWVSPGDGFKVQP